MSSDSATNASYVYAALLHDVTEDADTALNFSHAVQLSHLVDDLSISADEQRTVTPTAVWPS